MRVVFGFVPYIKKVFGSAAQKHLVLSSLACPIPPVMNQCITSSEHVGFLSGMATIAVKNLATRVI